MTSYENFQEAQLDRLADLLRRHLDMAQINAMIQT
jgi:cobyric acid synthase